jgi:hypothetical protein
MADRPDFMTFYRGAYAADHKHPANLALHMAGTIAGLGLLVASLTVIPLWCALAFPVVHAAPGLIGHRLFDRNEALGDIRVLQGDYPGLWYMAANHLMTGQTLWRALTLRGFRAWQTGD